MYVRALLAENVANEMNDRYVIEKRINLYMYYITNEK